MNKEYFREYYRNNLKKFRPGVGIKHIAQIKMCSRITVYRASKFFDKIPNAGNRFYFNDKIINWYPEYEKGIRKLKIKN